MNELEYVADVMETWTIEYPLVEAVDQIGDRETHGWAVRQILLIGTHRAEQYVIVVFERPRP